MKIVAIFFVLLLLYLVSKVWKADITDRTHPFGGDNKKLEIFCKKKKINEKLRGEDYGVTTYWGKPDNKDDIKKIIDKIQWLGTNHTNEILWRRCFAYSVVLTLLIILFFGLKNLKMNKIIGLLSLFYLSFYMAHSYEDTHLIKIKSKFIDQNIVSLKNILKVDQKNSIKNFTLI